MILGRVILREICGIFSDPQIKTQIFGENFGAFFARKFVPRTKIFRANFVLQMCHPKKSDANISDKFPGIFCGEFFWWIILGLFLWDKQQEKIHRKIHSKIQIRIWELRGQNPHCNDLALIIWMLFFLGKMIASKMLPR